MAYKVDFTTFNDHLESMMCLTEESLFLPTNYSQPFLGRTHIKDALYYFARQFCCMFKGAGLLAEYQVYRQ